MESNNFIEEYLLPFNQTIGSFLDYPTREEDGRKDGYFMHTIEYLQKKKSSFLSHFLHLVEKRLDELKQEKLRLLTLLIDLKDSDSVIVEKINLRLGLCDEYIQDLQNEKVLSKDFDGLVKKVILPYEVGYDLGMNDYINDEAFLNPIRRL